MLDYPYYLTSKTVAVFEYHGKILHRAVLKEPEGAVYDQYCFSLKTASLASQPCGPAREKYRDVFTNMLRYLGNLQDNKRANREKAKS